jgi:uncharacterized Ntn-hydrolase superfamily protein
MVGMAFTIAITVVTMLARYWSEQAKKLSAAESAVKATESEKKFGEVASAIEKQRECLERHLSESREAVARSGETARKADELSVQVSKTKEDLERHFTSHGVRERSQDQRFDEIDKRFDKMEERFNALERNMIDKKLIEEMNRTLQNVSEIVTRMDERYKNHDREIGGLRNEIDRHIKGSGNQRRIKNEE